jgi:hypothetical protein
MPVVEVVVPKVHQAHQETVDMVVEELVVMLVLEHLDRLILVVEEELVLEEQLVVEHILQVMVVQEL